MGFDNKNTKNKPALLTTRYKDSNTGSPPQLIGHQANPTVKKDATTKPKIEIVLFLNRHFSVE